MTDSLSRRRGGASAVALLGLGLAVAVVALVGASAATSSAQQYAGYRQPSWAPPPWLFGPVWTVLSVLIAVSGWLVWQRRGLVSPVLAVYALQLVLTMAWTPLFFGAGLVGPALIEFTLLWIAIVVTVVLFARTNRVAAWLLAPYLAWVTFAGALNLAILLPN